MSRINLNFTRQFNVVGVCVFSAEFIMATFERPGTSGCRVPPPLPGQRVPKEYVRQQLHDLGIKSISEEELESYTAGLAKLIKENLLCNDTSSSSSPDVSHKSPKVPLWHESPFNGDDVVPLDSKSSSPYSPYSLGGPGSAVFKTFPGDKNNRVRFLSPSPSPSPLRKTAFLRVQDWWEYRDKENTPSSCVLSSGGSTGKGKRTCVRRKVLRKHNGESRVFDESISDFESDKHMSNYLSELSLTSVTSTEVSGETSGLYVNQLPGSREYHQTNCCKSFIRPNPHPHTRGLKKSDPVSRYHEFREVWDHFKPPGELARNSLRWQIREQLMHQDVPFYEPQRRVYRPNEFVVPTEKKRLALRWQVRHALAHQ